MLLKHDANPNTSAVDGETPLLIAFQNEHEEMLGMLLAHKANPNNLSRKYGVTLLRLAVESGNKERVEMLLKYDADPNISGGYGETPLHVAAQNGHKEIVEMLLKHDADPNKVASGSPLHFAVHNGYKEIVEMLLKHKANPNMLCEDGETPLHLAAKNGHKEIFKLLLDQQPNPNILTKKGITPLHFAARNGQIEIVKMLLEKNADFTIPIHGKTSIQIAGEYGHIEIVNLIQKVTDLEKRNKERLAQYKKALILEIQSVNTLIAQASALEKEMGDTLHLVSHAKEQLNSYSKSLSLEKTTLSDQITLVEMQLENVSHLRPMLEKGIRMLKSKKNEAIYPVSDSGSNSGSNREVVLPPNKILHELMNALESGIKLFEKKLAAKSSAAVELALLRDAYGNADSPQTLVGIYSEMKKISLPKFDIKKYRDNTIRVKMIDIFIHLNTNL